MVKLTDVKGIGPATIKVLAERKIRTVEALAALSLAELQKIPGFSGDLRARAVKQSAADCLQGKAVKQTSVASSGAETTVKKAVKAKVAAGLIANQPEADETKDKSKKKAHKDGKKKVKDKEKKKKNKNKKKNGKKKDKKKS
jgi:hypothetical protein